MDPEQDAEQIIALYHEGADVWDSQRQRAFIERHWLERLVRLIPARGKILDIGCGAGVPIAEYFLRQRFRVTGIDASEAMIARCRQRFPRARWQVVDMRALALQRTFHGLIAWDSFFHLTREHQRAMFPRFARHAKPGAALLFTSGPGDGEVMGTFLGRPLYHASLDHDEYRQLLATNGFQVRMQVTEDASCGGHTVWLAQRANP
ncbi:class I SAM-dependent methyltransferase [Melittangium boletus]|uniref:class I SAM-dependent methyltransferase n=1 Tax=Melittangium boletus TaxID=83453 RepID=UPI003DA54EB3